MNRCLQLSLLIVSLSLGVCAQSLPPSHVREAAHCLVTDPRNLLDAQTLSAPELNLGFHLDTKTVLGDQYLYLVIFTTPGRDQGKIFDVRIKSHHTYSIENSATFARSPKGITFSTPPLGGQWAQNQLVTAIQGMEHHKPYAAEMKFLLKPSKSIHCESNMDIDTNVDQK